MADIPEEERSDLIVFSEYTHVSDLLTSWYIQEFIVPTLQEEEVPFNPFDPNQVDLSGLVNAPTEPPATTAPAS